VGKTMRIHAGQWKTVSDSTTTHVQVELHARLKKVLVHRGRVFVAGDTFGASSNPTEQDNLHSMNPGAIAAGSYVAAIGDATPMHGSSATPRQLGGSTPHHTLEMGGGDDVWRPGTLDNSIKRHGHDDDGWGAGSLATTNMHDDDGWGSTTGNANGNAGGWGGTTSQKKDDDEVSFAGTTASVATKLETGTVASSIKSEPKREDVRQNQQARVAPSVATADHDEILDRPPWFMERVCVRMKDSQQTAVIREIQGMNATVTFEDKSVMSVHLRDIAGMIVPVEHDSILVVGGNEIGVEGTLVAIDNTDAIIRDAAEEFLIVDFANVVKIADAAT
jgi:transcription elongation factor SPT5